jgi:hypothetical protein
MPDDPRDVLARYANPAEVRRSNADVEDEEAMLAAWIAGEIRSALALWRRAEGMPEPADDRPLTVRQAAEREHCSIKTIRRRLPALAAMVPPGAYLIGTTWRIVPAGLDALREQPTRPAPPPARKPKRKPPKRPTSTRWAD